MPSKVDQTAPEVYSKNDQQYKKGVTKESMATGDPEKKDREKAQKFD